MARLRDSWCISLPVDQQPRNPQSESIARTPYYWLDQGATRRVDLAPVRITCLTSAGSHALSKALQPFGVETTPELTPRSREDLEAKSSEGDVEDSPGDAD